ncbi:uncharacterized protein P884DRAFT_330213 [Thermothelomyces heterothallicus CBS 202.75]|uniref:uncharacterized protein n=1 Tax=Thermothelomyces heterothallicus CBS 202.75 TaxID=1149848 RepID=UPI003743DE2E
MHSDYLDHYHRHHHHRYHQYYASAHRHHHNGGNNNSNPPQNQGATAAAAGAARTNLQLALLGSVAAAVLRYPDLALLLLHGLARPLVRAAKGGPHPHPHPHLHLAGLLPSWLVPEALRPLRHGLPPSSPFRAALHALRWEVRRNWEALCCAGWAFAGLLLASSAGLVPAAAARAVVGWAVPLLCAAAELYGHLLFTCLGVTWAVTAVRVAWDVLLFAVWVVLQTARELAVQWTGFVRRHWVVIFAGLACWGLWEWLSNLDYDVLWVEAAHWFLLTCAELVYLSGDVVRDMAKSIEFDFV